MCFFLEDFKYFLFIQGMFETRQFILPDKVWSKKNLQQRGQFWDQIKLFMADSDLVCYQVEYKHQKYSQGDIVVVDNTEGGDKLDVGLIEIIIVRKNKVYFVLKRYVASKQELGYFEAEKSNEEITFIEAKLLADFKPLIMHGTKSKFHFVQHHHISYYSS